MATYFCEKHNWFLGTKRLLRRFGFLGQIFLRCQDFFLEEEYWKLFCSKKLLTETVIEDMERWFRKSESEIKKTRTKFEILTNSWYHVSGPTNQTQKETGKEQGRSLLKFQLRLWLKKCNPRSEWIYVSSYLKKELSCFR